MRDVHADSLATSSALSSYYVPEFIQPLDIIKVLQEAGVRFVLVGLHGIGGWMGKPRATQDVDIVVAPRHQKKAVKALTTAFPQLEIDDQPVVTRLRDKGSGKEAIDLIKTNQPFMKAVLENTKTVEAEGVEYLIPSLEMALVLKFAPMVSPNRAELDMYQDAHDFGYVVKSNSTIDLQVLEGLGELVYPGGGKEILGMVRCVRTGKKLIL